jgi:hypothetical protein
MYDYEERFYSKPFENEFVTDWEKEIGIISNQRTPIKFCYFKQFTVKSECQHWRIRRDADGKGDGRDVA